jgi:uncharacterized protein
MKTNEMVQNTSLKNLVNLLVDFFKSPRVMANIPQWGSRTFVMLLLITFLVIVPYVLVMELIGLDEFDHLMEELMKDNKLLVIILAIVIAPILEEAIFRYHLNLQKNAIILGLGLSVLAISQYWYLVVSFMVYLIYLFVRVNQGNPLSLSKVVYLSSVFFALVHMGNFRDFDFLGNFYWVPFLVAAQFFLGMLLSFIRLHYGLGRAMIFHGVYNAILVVPGVYFMDI